MVKKRRESGMLDERDLQAIAQIIDSKIQESEQRMTAKIEA